MQSEPISQKLFRPKAFILFLLMSVFFLPAITVKAVSLSEYQQNLQRAITALDTLKQIDEEETQSAHAQRITETVKLVRTLLPQSQMVDCGSELCSVDNTWLHDQLTEVEKAEEDPMVLITRVIEQLRALDERVKELQKGDVTSRNKEAAKERLAGILDRPEYATKGRASTALARIIDAITRWMAKLFGRQVAIDPSRGSAITVVVQWLVIVVAAAVLLYVIKLILPKFRRRRKKKEKAKLEPRIVLGEQLQPEASAVDLLQEAEALARGGQIRAAIRKAYIALLVELGDRKVVSLAHHKTNRDYLRSVRHHRDLYPVMSRLTDSFEKHWYGFGQAEAADWTTFRDGYKAALQTRV